MIDIQSALLNTTNSLSEISETALLDAEVLLSHALAKPRSHLRAWPEKILTEQEYSYFTDLTNQRQQGKPIAYVLSSREFWSRDFKVTEDTLIPRPDTELLIELSLSLLANIPHANIIDLGTGSGIIAITLAAEQADLAVTATDFSQAALEIAKENAATHQTNHIDFIHSDWFKNVRPQTFDLIVSNPPYIANNDSHLFQGDVRFEPITALTAGNDGLSDIKDICHHSRRYLSNKGTLLIEHGYDQQAAAQEIFSHFGYHSIKTHHDLSGNPRVTTGKWQKK